MAYCNDFLLMTFVSLAAFPLLLLIRAPKVGDARRRRAPAKEEAAHAAVMD